MKNITYSTINVIITNSYSDFENSSVLPERIGDHYALKSELQSKVEMPPKYEKITIHNYSIDNANAKAFQSYLANTDFTPLFRSNNVDDAFNILDTNLNKYHAHFFPLKVIKRHPKFIYKPSQESLNAIKLKKELHRKFKTKLEKVSDSSFDSCGACSKCINAHLAWEEYRKQRNLTNKITKANKREKLVNDPKQKVLKMI